MCQSKITSCSLVAHAKVALSKKTNFACKFVWDISSRITKRVLSLHFRSSHDVKEATSLVHTTVVTHVARQVFPGNAMIAMPSENTTLQPREEEIDLQKELNSIVLSTNMTTYNVKIVLKMQCSCPRVFVLKQEYELQHFIISR